MKRIKNIYWIAIIGWFFFLSCSDENGGFERKDLTFGLEVKAPEQLVTRADAYEEDRIDEIDVIIFKREGRKDIFYQHYPVPSGDLQSISGSNGKRFTLTLDKEVVDPKAGARLMVLANCHQVVTDFITTHSINLNPQERQYFHENLQFGGYQWKGANRYPFDSIPMCGIYPKYIIDNGEGNINNASLALFQALARIDIGIDMGNEKSETRDAFSIKNVYLFGTNTSGRIVRHFNEQLASPKTTLTNLPTVNERVLDYRHKYIYQENDNQSHAMRKNIYVTESNALSLFGSYMLTTYLEDGTKKEESKIAGTDPYNGTFLVLEAVYQNQTRYYRVDFADAYGALPLVRNNLYEINIMKVSNEGHATLEEAMKAVYQTKSSGNSSGLEVEVRINNGL